VTSAFGSKYEAASSLQENKNIITTSVPENIPVPILEASPEDLIDADMKAEDTAASAGLLRIDFDCCCRRIYRHFL
jgi:hypothetical protein